MQPDVVTLDISMPELDGISAAPLIVRASPHAELVILSQHDVAAMVTKALAAGVRGYVLKSRAGRDLLPAVEAAFHHEPFVSAELSQGQPPLPGPGPCASSGSAAQPLTKDVQA